MQLDKSVMGKFFFIQKKNSYFFQLVILNVSLGNRYIELFLKSTDCKPPRGIGTNGQYLFMLQMRGLPFKVTAKEIYKVFYNT